MFIMLWNFFQVWSPEGGGLRKAELRTGGRAPSSDRGRICWPSGRLVQGIALFLCDDAYNYIHDFKDYLIAFEKMLKNGYNSNDLVEGPQKWFGAVCTKNWETRGSGEFVWRCQ